MIDKEVVDTPLIVTLQSESTETSPKEPISELDKAAAAQATATTQPQAEPCYPTRHSSYSVQSSSAPRF